MQPDDQPTTPPKPFASVRRLLVFSGRLALALIVLGGLVVFLWPAPPPKRPETDNREAERIEAVVYLSQTPFLLTDLLGGDWRLAGSSWRTSLAAFDAAKPPQPPAQPRRDREKSEMDEEILRVFEHFGAQREPAGAFQRLHVSLQGYDAVAYTSHEPGVGELIESVQIAYGRVDDRSQLGLAPAERSHDGKSLGDAMTEAPPLHLVAHIKATRWTDDNVCAGAMGEMRVGIPALVRIWSAEGWMVESTPIEDANRPLVCRRGSQTWAATFFESSVGDPLILLVHVPDAPNGHAALPADSSSVDPPARTN